jgi:hypothetical protein
MTEISQTHTRIYQYHDSTNLYQREGQNQKLRAGLNHQNGAGTCSNPDFQETLGTTITGGLELAVGDYSTWME